MFWDFVVLNLMSGSGDGKAALVRVVMPWRGGVGICIAGGFI
jgi:hypothetical protein